MAPQCDEITDFELIRRMAEKDADFAAARTAWGELYVRHYRFLLRLCAFIHGYLVGPDGAKDVANEAFMKAFAGAATFDWREVCGPVEQSGKIRRWLATIAENVVRDRFRRQPDISFIDEDEIERVGGLVSDTSDDNAPPDSIRLKILSEGLATLTDVEQTVLRATMVWWQPNQTQQRMPSAALQRLSEGTGKSVANIRKIRSRAMEKLENFVNENLPHEKTNE